MQLAPLTESDRRLSPERAFEYLSQIDLFQALPAEEIHVLVPYLDTVQVVQGQSVFRQGDAGDALYLVEQGTARVVRDGMEIARMTRGDVFGELALLGGEPRAASIVADTNLTLLRVSRDDFQRVIEESPRLKEAFTAVAGARQAGQPYQPPSPMHRGAWRGRAVRALDARRRGIHGWQKVMGFGFLLWVGLFFNEHQGWLPLDQNRSLVAFLQLLAGLTILQGSCEAFVQGVERLGARYRWEGFIAGTIGSMVATLPEFVVIAFLVQVSPLAAFVTAVVTIYNNALAFSVYSFFLPKDAKGHFLMPPSLSKAGAEVLIAGSGIAMIIGVIMVVLQTATHKIALAGADLLVTGSILLVIYGYYTYELLRYYAQGDEGDHLAHPPNPHELGHDTSWRGIGLMFLLGIIGSYFGGESIAGFADIALNDLGLPTIPTASGLAFFAGISEYIIVFKAHRRGELSIALSNAFGGMTQVMFLLLPFAMVAIAIFGLVSGSTVYRIPITISTTMLILLLFPLFYVLLQYIEEDHTLSNLDAAAMTGIYALLLYFLFTASPTE